MAFLLCTSLSYTAAGQNFYKKNISISVAATVMSTGSVEIVTLQNISVGGTSRLTGELFISPLTGDKAGLMMLKGKPGSVARVRCLLTEELQEINGNGCLVIHYQLSGYPGRVQHAAKIIDTGEVNVTFNEEGVYYLWIGGRIDLKRALPGIYRGQFTIEVEYL